MKVNRKFLRSAERLSLSAIAKDSAAQRVVSAVTAIGFVLQPVAALASTITRADAPNTNLATGPVTNIFAEKVVGNVAINQFKEFQLDANNIANMYFGVDKDGNAGNLVNFVDSRIDINGTVNAIQNEKIGGNLFFFSSDGMAVGKTGVINAGALYVATPTKTAFDDYKKLDTEDKFNTIIKDEGFANIPINASGTISVLGKVNAVNAVNLRAAKIGVGKNVSGEAFDGVAAGATATGASIRTGVVDFKDIVNVGNANSGLTDDALIAEQTGSGDIVLAASNNYNDNYSVSDDFSNIAGESVNAELTVANDAVVNAAGNAKLSAQALNNVEVKTSKQYDKDYTPSASTNSHLYGQIVTTNATVNVDGTVEATQVDITADAVNRYVSAESSVLNASNVTSNIVGALTANLDASYAVLNSKAEVNVGQSAEINATGSDTVSAGKVVKPALNIKANSSVEAGAGASTALLKVMNVAGTNIIPAAAVTYSQTHNEAAVNIDGTLKSTGGTSVTALADSKVNSEAKATTMDVSENPNLGDVALNITTGDNKSSVTIGKTAQMTELKKDVNIEAKSVNSVLTKAEVSTGEKAVVATAINVTDYDSKANVNINGNVSSKYGSLAINAENVLTDNTVIANNAMGSSAFMKKLVTNIKGSQTLDTLIGEGGAKDKALGGIKNWLANAKYTPQKLKDKLNAPSTPSAPTEPKPWDKLADFMSTGVSVGVAVESNTADVKIEQGVALAAKNDLNITAKSVIEDTQMQITGKSNNYDKDTSNKALVNASVLYGKLDNTATVTIAGGEEAQNSTNVTNVTLTGGKVNIAANSSFEYNRIERMVQEVKDACAKVEDAYKGTNNADIKAKAKALSDAADAFFNYAKDSCFSSNGGEQVDFMDLFSGQKYKEFTDACSALTGALGDKATDIAVGPINVVSAAAAFANPNSYLNFSAGSANGGKSGPGKGEKAATIALAGSAVATDISNNARVLIGKNATITAKDELAMKATSKQFDVSLAGKLGLNGGGESAVGGTFAVGLADANSLVAVAQGAKLTAGSIAIGTENKIDHVQLSLAAGKGASKGVSGMVGYLEGASNSLVSVDDEAVINAGTGAVNLNAKNDTNVYSAAGAVAMGETAGIGVAATITNFDRYTYAAIGDNGYAAPPQATTKQGESGSDSGDKLGEDANADRSKEAEKLANTAAEKRATLQQLVQNASGLRQGTDDAEQADFFGSKTADGVKGSIDAGSLKVNAETGGKIINVAVAGGVSTGDDSGEAGIGDKVGNFVSNKTNALQNKLKALDHKVAGKINGLMKRQTEAQTVLPTDQKATGTAAGQQSSVTIAGAGSGAINLLDGDTGALVDNVKINIAKDTAQDKTITVTATDSAMMVAAGGAAGISWKNLTKNNNANSNNAAFGGTVAVNDIDSQTLAVISNSEIENAAAIINNAKKSGSLAAAGLGLALAKNSGGNGGTNIAATVNASVNIADNTAYALLQNNKVNTENVSGEDKRATSITNTVFDNDIQITGGVNTSLSIGGDNAFVGGATVAYGSLKNDVQAAILGGTYDKITTADVKATTNMTQVGVAANVSVAGGANTSYAFSGNSAYNKLDNYANATVEGVTLTGESLNVAAYDTAESANEQAEYLKQRGLDADGSAYLEQVKQAADASGDTDKPTNVDITRRGNVIVTGAVSVGVTTGNDGGSAAASVTVSDIDNDYNAKIKDSNITTTGKGSGDDLVGTNVNAASHTVLAGFAAGVAGTAGSFGVGGSANWQSLNNDITAAVENSTLVTPKTDVKAESGALAVNVAGQIGVTAGSKSKVGAGLAVAYNSLSNTTGAYVKGSEISGANDDASSILTVDVANKGNVYSVGAAVTAGTANALNGVVVVNRGRNDVEAVIDKYDGKNAKTTDGRTKLNNMSKVAVKSSDDSNQLAVVGAVSVSAGGNAKFAAGGSVAYNEIGNITGSAGEKKQTNKAAINNADITTTEDGKISVNAVDESTLTTISVGTSITTGNVAFSGAGSAAMIKKDTDTELVNTNINKDKNNAATVQATADSKGKITTVAVVAAGAKDVAIGAGIAVNQLDADTNTNVTKGEYKVKGFTAEAKSDSSILSVGVAGGVAKTAGIAGNIGVNLLANDTKATIDGAKINADGTLAVIAKSKDTLQNFAGAFGVAAGGQAGVGMGVAYNEISGTTESVVKNNAELTAAGNDAGVAVNERNKDNDNVVSDKKRTGVIIAADAEHKLTNVAISGGVAVSADVGVGVAGTVTVNRILGATNAKVTDSSINAALTDRSKADVYVAANDATKSESHVGSLGVGGGADGGAGVGLASDTGVVSRNVTAMIDGGSAKKLVNGNSIDVAALNKAKMSTNSYGVAAAGGAYGAGAGAGTVSVAKLDAETTAAVKNIQGTNNGLAITADHVNDITLCSAAAAASGALVSAAGGAGIGVVDDDSKTVAELSGSNVKAETGDITVNAANKTDVTTAVFGVAASMVAGGLNVAVNNLDNTVSTLVKDNSNLQVQGTFAAKADNSVKTSFVNGADAVGAAGVAVGVGVNTIDTGVITEISGSKITAGAIDVAATEKLDVKQVVENAALGGHGYSANVSVTTIGAAAADQYGDTETTDSDKKATFNTNDILGKANAAIAGQGTVGTVAKDGKSSSNTAGMTFDKYTGSNGEHLSAAPGTTASKGSGTAEGVQAKVSNSTLQATGDTKVNAQRTVDAELTSAQVAAGFGGNGIASSVAVLNVERKTGVTINNNSKLSGKNVTLGSAQDGTSKIDAYQVAAGGTAGSAAYAQNSLHGANAITINSSTVQATGDDGSKGTLTVKAEDTSSAAVSTIGATAGAMAGGVLVTNATNNSDNTVTIGGSKLIAGKEYSYGNGYYNIGKVDVASVKANSITAETYGGMVGIAAAQGIVALAADAGSSKVNVTGASGFLGNSVSLNATNKPAVRAEAQAYSGGLLAVAGVAVSKAKASGTVEAKVADGSSFAADNVEITANVTTQTAKDKNDNEYVVDNVSAKTIGATASGQYAAGFNTAYAENDMTVSVDVGKEQYNVNALKLKADNASVISADTLGVTVGGYIASGSNWSDTKTNLTTSVKAAGVKENVYNSLGAVNISSSGYSAVNNDANGYGGGIVGFNPVAARSQNQITTNTTADVSGKWQNVGSLSVAANNADKLDILADSLTAAVVGASGTEIKNNVAHKANINVTGNITTSGKQSYIANNTLNHDVDLKGSGYGGGSVNVNDMDNVLKYTAGVNIDNANLSGIGSAGSIEALAYTDGKMNYSNTLKSAGVVPVTIAASKNVITYNNSINVTGSNLSTAKADQDITLAATDETTATFDTTADTQGGAVGAASAKTDNTLNRSNKITVTDGKILSTNDVNIYAGANLDGITSSLTYNVLADAYNKTAVPLATAPKAKNTMTQENQVSINGDIDSVRHVNFKAGKGMTTVSTSAREYNIYKGTSGSGSVTSTALGEVTPGETVTNYVDIASGKKVRAGIHNNLELTISGSTKVTNPEFDASGNVISGKEGSIDFSGIKVETGAGQDWFNKEQNVVADVVDLENGLYARLEEINDLLGQYASTSDEYIILNNERDRIINQMEENGFVKTSVKGGKTYKSIFDKISLPAVDVKDIVVSGGNINIEADKLQGSGSLTAQGAKNLTINNSSDLYLKINDLAIKDKGGVIRYNDAEVSKVDGFTGTMNTAAGTDADPKITVKSTGTSNNGLTKADIGIFGTVQNSTGDVLIQNSNYNINVDGNANISARNIELKADKGSVTQNSKGLLLIGGDPVTKYQFSDAIAKKIQSYVSQQAIAGKTTIDWLSNIDSYDAYKKALVDHKDDLRLTEAEVNEIKNYSVNKSSGIVAGNNVYISGLNVNLDGLVQSGYKNFKVTLDNAANNKISNLDRDYARNQTALTDQYVMSNDKYCVSTNAGAVYNAATGAYDYTVKVYYNPATKELLTEAIEPNGGKIYITGALSSTGSGQLLAMDGTANIAINTTNADRNLRVNKITNKDITGLISIKDTQKNTLTEYTTDGQKMSVKTTTLNKKGNAISTSTTQVNGSTTTYAPAKGMTINWTGGTSGDKKIIKWQYEKDFVFWGLIKYGTTKDFVENEEVKNGKTEVSSSSITGADPLGQGTVIKVNNNAKEYGVTTKEYNDPNATTYTPVVENKKYSGLSGKIFGYGNCTYTWTETQMHSTSSTYTIKGDKPINVGFMTGGSGDISVTSAKDMYLAGNISNATKADGSAIGKVTLNSNGGVISSVGSARVDADDLTANAAKGISINHSALGNMAKLNIEATTGDVSINSDRGKLQFVGGNKGALSGNLVINAAGDITTADGTVLNGNRIDFTTLGAINAAIAPGQTLTSSDTMSASVNANAYGDITLTNSNGDMRIGHIASQTGDVNLTTSGSFIDAVGDSTLSDSEGKLQKWQELGLINNNDKAEESAASAAAAKSERVQALEKQAQRLDAAKVDNYKAAAKEYNDKFAGSEALQQAKKAYIDASAEAAKLTDENAQKQALTNARNAYMQALRKDSVFADKGYSDAELQWIINYAEVDNSTAYGWSKNELLYAIQDSVLNAAPGQVLTVDKANVQGKNISLSAGKNIGIDGEATNIAYSEMGKLDNLKLLAQAKAGDLTWNDNDSRIEVRQQRQITVQLADDGKLNLKANTSNTDNTGNVYLAGVKDTMLDISGTIKTTQDVKLLSDKGIRMNDGSIVADNLIIQGGKGDVGSKDALIKTNISGNLEANTDTGYGVYLHQTAAGDKPAQVLTIQDAATGTLVLKADNGMQMTTEAGKNTGYLNANSINLQAANGDIGKADDGIRILENGAVINAKAENGSVYLQGAGTKDAGLVVDSITAKGNAKLNLDGDVNFGNDTGNGSISAGGDVTVNGNNVNLNAGTVTAGGVSNITAGKDVNVTTGSITSSGAGNITAGNNVNLNSSTLAAGADSVITATNGNIALGSSGIKVNGANKGLTLNANGSVMQEAAAAGITADNLTVESGKTQQLLSKSNKVKSLNIKGKGAGSDLTVDGGTTFNGTSDELQVTVENTNIKGDLLIENFKADTGKITINSTIDTSKYNDEHTGNITVKADGDITTADGVDLNAADKVSINSKKGSVVTGGNVTANKDVDIDAAQNIIANGNLTSTNANVDLKAGGSITTKGTVNAHNSVIANANGNIITIGDVTAQTGKAALNSNTGNVNTGNVTANKDVDIDAAQNIIANGNLTSTNANVDLKAGGSITTKGTVNAHNSVIANANGNIITIGDVTAQTGKAALNSNTGNVNTGNVTANKDVDIDAAQNIIANGNLTSTNANVDLKAGGSITTKGTVNANNNVIANAKGDINTNGDVTAETGNAVINSSEGNVTTKNVTADQAVDIDAAQDITANGNLKSTNANVDLNAGGSITTKGQVAAQKNVDYNAKGSITTGNIINSTAGNINLQTDAAQGNITFGGDVTAEHGNINIDVLQNGSVKDPNHKYKFKALGDKGDINSGNFKLHIKGAGDVDLNEIFATNKATIDVTNGNLTLATINGDMVALQLRTEGKQLKVDELIAGTKIIAQGSDIDLNKIQQRLDADGLLTIIPDGAQLNKPIDNLKIGEIITNKGVRFEHLWLNNGSIKVSEGMFHIDKLVVNNVAHFSNKHMKTAVWGAPPQRDGSDSVYWNNIAVNYPADNLTEWQQEGTNPDKWMYLHFTAQPNVQHSNGALLDLRNYDYVYDQRFTAVDHMLQQLNENKAEEYDINHAPVVAQYFRYDLYDLDEEDSKSEPAKITVEA
jgi:hypothetical protein